MTDHWQDLLEARHPGHARRIEVTSNRRPAHPSRKRWAQPTEPPEYPGQFKVSTDELLGLKPSSERTPPKTARLRKRLQLAEALPAAGQHTVLNLVEALAEARRSAKPRPKAYAVS